VVLVAGIAGALGMECGCSKKNDVVDNSQITNNSSVTASVGSEGAHVEHPDGASVDIPPGALTAKTTITIRKASQPDYPSMPGAAKALSPVFSFEPHGQTFALDVVVTLKHSAGAARIWSAQPDYPWEALPNGTDTGGYAQSRVTHFSYFVALEGVVPDAGTDAPADTGTGLDSGEDSAADTGVDTENGEETGADVGPEVATEAQADTGEDDSPVEADAAIADSAVDTGSGPGNANLYVGNLNAATFCVFKASADGDVAPVQLIQGANTSINAAASAFVYGGELFVSQHLGHSITVFPPGASGDAYPTRKLSGAATGLINPSGILVDAGELFVAPLGTTTLVFDATASGDVPSKRSIGSLTKPYALALSGNDLFMSRHANAADSSIYVYSRDAIATDSPLRTIAGSNTSVNFAAGLHTSGGELFVANYDKNSDGYTSTINSILVFDQNGAGNLVPKRLIAGAATQLSVPGAIFVYGGEIYVSNRGANNILVFNVNDVGNVAPKRSIGGTSTNLAYPLGLFIQ